MYRKLLAAAFITLPAVTMAADKGFSLKVDGVDRNGFLADHLLSEPYGFGCSGKNLTPAISWKNAPKGTKSFVLTLHDRDAPTGLGWMHWVVVNIPADATSLPAGITAEGKGLPAGAMQTRTDFGVPGYGGPCPPQGNTHRYDITLTALKTDKLPNVTADAMPALVGFFARANALGEARVTVEAQR